MVRKYPVRFSRRGSAAYDPSRSGARQDLGAPCHNGRSGKTRNPRLHFRAPPLGGTVPGLGPFAGWPMRHSSVRSGRCVGRVLGRHGLCQHRYANTRGHPGPVRPGRRGLARARRLGDPDARDSARRAVPALPSGHRHRNPRSLHPFFLAVIPLCVFVVHVDGGFHPGFQARVWLMDRVHPPVTEWCRRCRCGPAILS
jgi:hypothetical protein